MRRVGKHGRFKRFAKDISQHTPFTNMVVLLVVLWFLFSAGLYFAEQGFTGTTITSYGAALYWSTAAFSTAGIASEPISALGKAVGGLWIVIGSVLFFGAIVATVTSYFMRPLQRPHKKIIETIEYNLEQLNDLSVEELDLLKETVDVLISNVEELKSKQEK